MSSEHAVGVEVHLDVTRIEINHYTVGFRRQLRWPGLHQKKQCFPLPGIGLVLPRIIGSFVKTADVRIHHIVIGIVPIDNFLAVY